MRMFWLAAVLPVAALAQEAPEGDAVTLDDGETVFEPPPETSLRPEPRPDPEDRIDAEALEPEAGAPAVETAEDAAPGVWEQLVETEEELAQCAAALDAMGAIYERLDPITEADPDCGIANPFEISTAAEGVEMSSPITLRCETARAMAEWTVTHLQPATAALGRGPLVRLDHGGGYTCRRRNNAPDGKLSEHSFGNGIDIMGFAFESGDPIAVEPREDEGTLAEAYQRSARATSCLYFTTVLGPGTDAAHADHLHMDVKERRGGYRLCQ